MFFKRKVTPQQLLELLDSMNEWSRALFYADPQVERILSQLYQRWNEADRRGEPIDYATQEELRTLYKLAEKYSRIPPWQAYRMLTERN